MYLEPNKIAEAATSSYFATGDFLQYVYSVYVTKNHQKIWSRCLVHDFSLQISLRIIMVTEQLYWRKITCGCFHFIWLWLLIAIVKRCIERCAVQLLYCIRFLAWWLWKRWKVFFNWDSLHARLNSHYEVWSYKKKKHKKIRAHRISV